MIWYICVHTLTNIYINEWVDIFPCIYFLYRYLYYSSIYSSEHTHYVCERVCFCRFVQNNYRKFPCNQIINVYYTSLVNSIKKLFSRWYNTNYLVWWQTGNLELKTCSLPKGRYSKNRYISKTLYCIVWWFLQNLITILQYYSVFWLFQSISNIKMNRLFIPD